MIGLYGGTFDPIHFGHLRTAIEVKEFFSLSELRLIPCANPPHRKTPLTPPQMRLDMLKLAIQNHSGLVVDGRELDRDGFSYTIDTLRSLVNDFAQESFILFMGTDAFHGLESWHQWQKIFDYANIVVITRPGYQKTELSEFLSAKLIGNKTEFLQKNAGALFFQQVTQLDISATMIRNNIKAGRNPVFLLPDIVIDYINRHNLYQ